MKTFGPLIIFTLILVLFIGILKFITVYPVIGIVVLFSPFIFFIGWCLWMVSQDLYKQFENWWNKR